MQDTVAARKYAQALFAEAMAKDQLLACQQGLAEIQRVVRLRKSLSEILEHPFISLDEKERMIRSSMGEYAMPLLERFLLLLIKRHRFDLLFQIGQEFQAAVDRLQNIQPLRIRTAFPLSDAKQKQLKTVLESWLKSQVRMDVQVDPQLIGGLVIQTRDQIIDQSLKGQLQKLQQQLSN